MVTNTEKKSQSRMFVAIALFLASIATSFLIAYLSHQGSSFWVMRTPLPMGAEIKAENVGVVTMKLARATQGYLPGATSPIGSITTRALMQGEILHRGVLSSSDSAPTTESISLAIAATDIPSKVAPGDLVSIYQLHDARNGESEIAPHLVISPVYIEEISGKEGNFSGELSITVSLNRTRVPTLLAATTSGRLVIVAIRG
jgi:hypothetical protein